MDLSIIPLVGDKEWFLSDIEFLLNGVEFVWKLFPPEQWQQNNFFRQALNSGILKH